MEAMSLMATLGLDSKEFEQGLEESEHEAKTFGEVLGDSLKNVSQVIGDVLKEISNLGQQFVQAVGQVAQYGDNIDKSSQKMNISAQAYQEWDFILQHSGSSIDSMRAGMRSLSNAIASGSDAFTKLGISQEQVSSMSQEDLFAAAIAGLQNVSDETERTQLAMELFGRSAMELGPLLNTSAEETEAMRQRVHDLGGVMTDEAVKASARYQDSLQDLQTVFSGAKNNLLSEFLPGMSTVMDGLTDLFAGKNSGVENIIVGIYSVVDKMRELAPQLAKRIRTIVKQILPAVKIALKAIVDVIGDLLPIILDAINEIMPVIADALPGIIEALLPSLLSALGQLVGSIISNLPSILSALWAGVTSAFKSLWDAIKDIDWLELGQTILTFIGDAFTGLWNWFAGLFSDGADGAENGVDWSAVGTRIWTAITTGIGTVWEWFKNKFEYASTWVQSIDWLTLGKNIITFIGDGIGSVADWMKELFDKATEAIKGIGWASVGSAIWTTIKKGFQAVFNVTQLFGGGGSGESFLGLGDVLGGGDSADFGIDGSKFVGLGHSIANFIIEGIGSIGELLAGVLSSMSQDILNYEWSDLGSDVAKNIRDGIDDNASAGISFFGFFSGIYDAIVYDLPWEEIGEGIGNLIGSGITALSEFLGGALFEAISDGVTGGGGSFDWESIGQWILDHLLTGNIAQDFLTGFGNGLNEGLGPLLEDFSAYFSERWEEVKPLFDDLGEDISGIFESAKGVVGQLIEKIQLAIDKVLDFLGLNNKNEDMTDNGLFPQIPDEQETQGFVNSLTTSVLTAVGKIGNAKREASEMIDELKEESSTDIEDGMAEGGVNGAMSLTEALESIGIPSTVKEQVELGFNSVVVPTMNVPIRYVDDGNSFGVGRRHATAMDSGEILHGLTPFGIDSGGVVHYGGEAGPEAVVGVNSLHEMIQRSVNSAMSRIQTVRQPVSVQLVLDSGELLGAVDLGLNDIASWKGGGHA